MTNPFTEFYNKVIKEVPVTDENLPPTARFDIGSQYGNILTQFYFDAWSSTDDRLIPSEIEIRWDFDGDGVWDTPFSKEKTVYHQYAQPGVYQATLQVVDDADQQALAPRKITVSGNTNPTSFFRDQRDGQFYGTVTIGDQVWMSENMNFTIPKKQIANGTFNQWNCLFEQADLCQAYSKMYYVSGVIENRGDSQVNLARRFVKSLSYPCNIL